VTSLAFLVLCVARPQTVCPVCRAPVEASSASQKANVLISNLIATMYARQLEVGFAYSLSAQTLLQLSSSLQLRKAQEVEEIEDERNIRLPVFVLDVMVFPGQPVVYRIFEPRYITMVNRVLDGNRMFALQPTVEAEMGTTVGVSCRGA